jgi:hypothetical protein
MIDLLFFEVTLVGDVTAIKMLEARKYGCFKHSQYRRVVSPAMNNVHVDAPTRSKERGHQRWLRGITGWFG